MNYRIARLLFRRKRNRWHNPSSHPHTNPIEYEVTEGPASISMQDVSVQYANSKERALSRFSIDIAQSEFVSILGRSGAGKTTVLRAIAGFEKVCDGYVRIGGRLVASSFVHLEPNVRRIGFVFQDYALFPHLNVEDNVGFGLRKDTKSAKHRRVSEILETVGLAGFGGRFPNELSGGEQQRVALARALVLKPAAVLLDEPFSSIDKEFSATLRREVQRILKSAGATTVMVTHEGEEAMAMSDKVAVMVRNGSIMQIGSSEEVYRHPISPAVARLIGPCEIADGMVRNGIAFTEMGALNVAKPYARAAEGKRVDVLLRASELELIPPNGDNISGRVVFRAFMGEFAEFGVQFPSGAVTRVRQRARTAFKIGDIAALRQRPGSSVIIYPKE